MMEAMDVESISGVVMMTVPIIMGHHLHFMGHHLLSMDTIRGVMRRVMGGVVVSLLEGMRKDTSIEGQEDIDGRREEGAEVEVVGAEGVEEEGVDGEEVEEEIKV